MKYIRTEDGRIFDTTYISTDEYGECFFNSEIIIHFDEIVAQADTIEELCDEFVVKWFNKVFHYSFCENFKKLEYAKAVYEKTINNSVDNQELYGAIWTDKGLIYVAKMNEDGELCLL